jgi:IMP dehydrogenase/GMP reductase
MLYDFDDILIQPTKISEINSRSQVTPYHENGFLPIMTAPMDTVINNKNFKLFQENKITPILPRIYNPDSNYVDTGIFLSYSLEDFERIFLYHAPFIPENQKALILIDVANGHMDKLYQMAKKAKIKYGDSIFLMVGNVANPETYYEYAKIGVDAVRIGIGNGNGCLTTVQTGVGYPMASLIEKCNNIKQTFNLTTQIIADGGFKKYADIIKALALGADYIMVGSILNKALESAGETIQIIDTLGNHEVIDQFSKKAYDSFEAGIPLHKTFRGMSTKEVQKLWGKETLTTSEGVVRRNDVEYTLKGWTNNFESYLRSAMSYSGKEKLRDFIGGVTFNFITMNSFKRFDK